MNGYMPYPDRPDFYIEPYEEDRIAACRMLHNQQATRTIRRRKNRRHRQTHWKKKNKGGTLFFLN